jgi:peptidoglycan/xylan/chitin deacetylase (PgdA/CDA1 family)
MPGDQPVLYLTFDDGPTPGITDRLLDLLDQCQAKASFFLVGDKAARHPELVRRIHSSGHAIGNHTQHHLNGWKTPSSNYLADVEKASESLEAVLGFTPTLFRPPYGKVGHRNARKLSEEYKIVMWDVMPGDFLLKNDATKVSQTVIHHARAGSVVVLHDSEKCGEKMLEALPGILEHFAAEGYRFEALRG